MKYLGRDKKHITAEGPRNRRYQQREVTSLSDSIMSSAKLFQIADFACLLIVGLINALLGLVIPPYRRGFFCDDDSIKYPFTANESLPNWAVILVSVVVPVTVVSILALHRKLASLEQMFLNAIVRVNNSFTNLRQRGLNFETENDA